MNLKMNLQLVLDQAVRLTFEQIQIALSRFTLSNFVSVRVDTTLSASAYPATLTIAHGLKAVPTDVIQGYATPGGTLEWLVDQFTSTQLLVTVYEGPVHVRAFVGYYRSDA